VKVSKWWEGRKKIGATGGKKKNQVGTPKGAKTYTIKKIKIKIKNVEVLKMN
jgi:hypothetical protein